MYKEDFNLIDVPRLWSETRCADYARSGVRVLSDHLVFSLFYLLEYIKKTVYFLLF